MTDLKHCPFCGSINIDPEGWTSLAEFEGTKDYRSGPACDDCGASAQSIDEWNKRTIHVDEGAAAKALRLVMRWYGESPIREIQMANDACGIRFPAKEIDAVLTEHTVSPAVPGDYLAE